MLLRLLNSAHQLVGVSKENMPSNFGYQIMLDDDLIEITDSCKRMFNGKETHRFDLVDKSIFWQTVTSSDKEMSFSNKAEALLFWNTNVINNSLYIKE